MAIVFFREYSWQPGTNTLLYVPMDTDLLDHSGKGVSISNNGITLNNSLLQNTGVGYFKGGSEDRLEFSGIEFGTLDFTISWWENTLGSSSGQGSRFASAWTTGSWAGILLGYQWTNIYAGSGTSWNVVNGNQLFSSTPNTWVHWVITREGSNWKTYRNNVLFGSVSASGTVGYNTEVIGNYRPGDKNPYYGYMSNFIIERGAWSDTDRTNYYNYTKSLYGL